MKTVITFLVCACACFVLLQNFAVAQTAEKLFQEGVRLEEVKGNLEQAIEIYKSVVGKYPGNQPLAAKSLLRMGRCYEKLGKDEAKKAYERIIKEYASQPDVVTEARARLAVLMDGTKLGGSPIARRLISDNVQPEIRNPRIITPSPDGRWVAYTQKELCIRNLESGEVKQIVPGEPEAQNWSVVWSPDGKRLAFWQRDLKTKLGSIKIHHLASGETVTVLNSGESELYLLDWSRDGLYLLCNHARNTLELVTIKDGTMTTLSDSVWQGQRASFSPDGQFVTFARGKSGTESAYTQSVASGQRHRIADFQAGTPSYLHPLWSPDGNAIAYQGLAGIWVVPVSRGVASGPARLAYKTDIARWPVTWTKQGLYVTYNAENFYAFQVAVDPKTGQLGTDGPQSIPDAPDNLTGFAWSPDMKRIFYTGWNGLFKIYATSSKSMTSYDSGTELAFEPSWSADGREVFYTTYQPMNQKGFIRVLDVGSGKFRDLFPPMGGFTFSLSSDGHRMVYHRRGKTQGTFEVVVAETNHPDDGRVMATGPMQPTSHLSPRGDQILFVRKGDTDSAGNNSNVGTLWVMAADGSGTRRVAAAPIIDNAMWDPTGRFIAYTVRTDTRPGSAWVLRVVEVATGVERGSVPISHPNWAYLRLTHWSPDGKYIGFFGDQPWWEYWMVQGLQDGVR
ncbi:MAG: tetratricopeptide repeat protein [Ignavibacteria bacterium]|nr:tetratricopeptide repeat protein [Ignavibacteria bacterium]